MGMVPDAVLGVYHRNKQEFVSVLKAAVLAEAQFEVLPEILDIFGDDAVKFLEIFSGRVISVPPIRDLVAKMRQVSVWVAMGQAKKMRQDYEVSVEAVSKRLGMKKSDVRSIDKNISDLMAHLSMELRPEHGNTEEKEG